MKVIVYSIPSCGICEAAKDKLRIMKIPFKVANFEMSLDLHPGWRDDGTSELLSAAALNNNHPPIIRVDDQFYTYSAAMKVLRGMQSEAAAVYSVCQGDKREITSKNGG